MLVVLPAGRCGGDEFDARATAPWAPAVTGSEARGPQACAQAVPTAGGEGVAAAPTETQASTCDATATAIATGNGGGDHSCRREDMVRITGRRGDARGCEGVRPDVIGAGMEGPWRAAIGLTVVPACPSPACLVSCCPAPQPIFLAH